MRVDDFNDIVNQQINLCIDVLEMKSKEYAPGNDRLEHFKISASEQDILPEQALWGMAAKHFTSLNSMCKSGNRNMNLWLEKITDSINYLLLLRALIEEEVSANE